MRDLFGSLSLICAWIVIIGLLVKVRRLEKIARRMESRYPEIY